MERKERQEEKREVREGVGETRGGEGEKKIPVIVWTVPFGMVRRSQSSHFVTIDRVVKKESFHL